MHKEDLKYGHSSGTVIPLDSFCTCLKPIFVYVVSKCEVAAYETWLKSKLGASMQSVDSLQVVERRTKREGRGGLF